MDAFTSFEATFMGWLIPVFNLVDNNRYAVALIVMLLTISIAWLVSRIVHKYLHRLLRKTRNTVDEELLHHLRQPVFFTILLFGIDITADILVGDGKFIRLLDSAFSSLLVLIWTIFFIRATRLVLTSISHKETGFVTSRTLPILQNLTLVIISSIAIYLLFTTWNIDMTAWLASAGVLGIAIGFAAKDTLGNLISGVFIMADAPYKIGDYVVLQDGLRGEIRHIGLRSTRLLTRDDVEVTIPNSIMGNTAVINETGGPHEKYRIRVKTRLENSNNRLEKARDRLELMKASGRYNLTTSLKNYIDPRIYRDWGEEVDYSWEKFYSSSLRKKFSWLSKNCENTS